MNLLGSKYIPIKDANDFDRYMDSRKDLKEVLDTID